MSEAARKLRIRMANNGRNPANGNMGIRVGSDLHLAEMLLKERDALLAAAKRVYEGLNLRLDHAAQTGAPSPIFTGIGDLRDAIAESEST